MPRGRPTGSGLYGQYNMGGYGAGGAAGAVIDDGRPKGKMTSYAFFVQTCREEHKKKFPDEVILFAEFNKKCADRWKTMSEKEKKRFNDMAEEDKKRYAYEMANYVPRSMQLGPPGSHAAAGAAGHHGAGGGLGAGSTMGAIPGTSAASMQAAIAYAQAHAAAAAAQQGGRRGRRSKKMKRLKDPNAPKRCM